VTVRNITMRAVDSGIRANHEIAQFMAYDNTMIGTTPGPRSTEHRGAPHRLERDLGRRRINISGFGNARIQPIR